MTISIEPIRMTEIADVAELHIAGICHGFLSSLGPKFVAALYEVLANNNDSVVLVAKDGNKVIGFAAFSKNIKKLYLAAAFSHGFRFLWLIGWKLLSWQRIVRILGTVLYPFKKKKLSLPDAELLSTAIAPQARGQGIATMLVREGMRECARRGISKIKVLVRVENVPANILYKKCGFEVVSQIDSHGFVSNIRVVDLQAFADEIKLPAVR